VAYAGSVRSPQWKVLVHVDLPLLKLILQILLAVLGLLTIMLVLLHKGRGGGLSDMFGGGVSSSASASGVAERNLNRLTVGIAVSWGLCAVGLGIVGKRLCLPTPSMTEGRSPCGDRPSVVGGAAQPLVAAAASSRYQVVESRPRTAEAGTSQGSIRPCPSRTAPAFSAPATSSATCRDEFSTGQVSEIRSGGGLGESVTPVALALTRRWPGCSGNSEAMWPSGPTPSSSTSKNARPRVRNGSSPPIWSSCWPYQAAASSRDMPSAGEGITWMCRAGRPRSWSGASSVSRTPTSLRSSESGST